MELSKIIDTLETYQPPDGISREQELTAAEKVFCRLLCCFPDFREFIEVELGQTEQRWAHEAPGRATPTGARPGGSWPPPLFSGPVPKLLVSLMSRKKSPKSFVAFGLCLVLIFWKTKNRQKTATGTGH
jgi:hypothetical protein